MSSSLASQSEHHNAAPSDWREIEGSYLTRGRLAGTLIVLMAILHCARARLDRLWQRPYKFDSRASRSAQS